MRLLVTVAALFGILALAGCETQNTYPLTGQECGPDDPVKTLDASDCAPV